MTDWRDAQPDGIHSCSHRCTRPACMDARAEETERLRTEAARLLALFAEAKAHPASAWGYVEQALGGDPLPRRASLVAQPDGSHAPQH